MGKTVKLMNSGSLIVSPDLGFTSPSSNRPKIWTLMAPELKIWGSAGVSAS